MPSSRNEGRAWVFVCRRQLRQKCQAILCVNSGNMLGLHSHKGEVGGGVSIECESVGGPGGRGLTGRKDRSQRQFVHN